MPTSTRTVAALLTSAALSAVIGCGGGGSSQTTVPNAYAGHYIGTWTDTETPPWQGSMDFTVHADGSITGTLTDGRTKETMNVESGTSSVSGSGGFGLRAHEPGYLPWSVGSDVNIEITGPLPASGGSVTGFGELFPPTGGEFNGTSTVAQQ